jgi:DNA-directed RNA polymerase subunit RPC12/RpoP
MFQARALIPAIVVADSDPDFVNVACDVKIEPGYDDYSVNVKRERHHDGYEASSRSKKRKRGGTFHDSGAHFIYADMPTTNEYLGTSEDEYDSSDDECDSEEYDDDDDDEQDQDQDQQDTKQFTKQSYDKGNSTSVEVQCYFCSELMPKNTVKEHMIKTHGRYSHQKSGPPRQYKCHVCNESLLRPLEKCPLHLCFMATKPRQKGEPIKCEVCEKTFSEVRKLVRHTQTIHSDYRPFECTMCDYKAKTNFYLITHINRVHKKERNVACSQCGETFFNSSDLYLHDRNRHQPKLEKAKSDWPCDTCGKMFDNRRSMACHRKFHFLDPSKTPKFPCETCGKIVASKWILTEHIKWEHPTRDEIDQLECFCQKCKLPFPTSLILNEHLAQCLERPLKTFKCSLCDKNEDYVWHSAIAMKKHIAEIHRCNRPVCDICGFVVKSVVKGKLEFHKRTVHEGLKDWACDICGKTYTLKDKLQEHVEITHENRTYKCDQCGKEVTSRASLQTHMAAVHERKIEYNCNLCEHKTFAMDALKKHIRRVHEKSARMYPCIICNKKFNANKRLSLHMDKHHGVERHIH